MLQGLIQSDHEKDDVIIGGFPLCTHSLIDFYRPSNRSSFQHTYRPWFGDSLFWFIKFKQGFHVEPIGILAYTPPGLEVRVHTLDNG